MKKQHKKTNDTRTAVPKVKRSKIATAVNENRKPDITKRSTFTDELGTDVRDPNKVTR